MKVLQQFSIEELQEELNKRKEIKNLKKPELLEFFDLSKLKSMCQSYINDIDELGHTNEDTIQYIFECAIETFFGHEVWSYINKKIR